jgi:DNA polymerase (family X)
MNHEGYIFTEYMPNTVHTRKIFPNNAALSVIFHQMAGCYRFLGTGERFRALAYENVAKILHNMEEDIARYATSVKKLDAIGGIGESIAKKIIEFLQTGKIKTFEQLKKKVPFELLELLDISGLGPSTLQTLHKQLHIHNRLEFIEAIEAGKLSGLKGFGQKRIENIKRVLKIFKVQQRMPLAIAEKIGKKLLEDLRKLPGVQKAELAGSIRRKKETIGDIDIVVLAETRYRKKIADLFIQQHPADKILARGKTKISLVLKQEQVQVDIRLVHDYEYGAAMLYSTGSKEHNIKLRRIAQARGYKINEYGIFNAKTDVRVAGATEEEMYKFLRLKYIPPENRLDKGEIEKDLYLQ